MRHKDKVARVDDWQNPKVERQDNGGSSESSVERSQTIERVGCRQRAGVYLAIGGAAQNASAIEGDDIATTMWLKTVATAPATQRKKRRELDFGMKAVKKGKRGRQKSGPSAPTFQLQGVSSWAEHRRVTTF